jgi:hypothetical protein
MNPSPNQSQHNGQVTMVPRWYLPSERSEEELYLEES